MINTPENQQLLKEILFKPDTVDFVFRIGRFSERILQNYEIAIAHVFSGRYAVAYASESEFLRLRDLFVTEAITISSVVFGPLARPSLESAGIIQVQERPFLNLKGQGVIIGFIDTGIDYTLDVFKYENGDSKILYIYDQTVDGPQPEGTYLGVEYTNEQINTALHSDNPLSIVPQTDTSGHGTFLASVAAGSEIDNFIGAAPEAQIIAVKLRKARAYYLDLFSVPSTQEYVYSSSSIMLGIEYILEKARGLNRPVSICLGLGSNYGSHDGYSIFEEYLNSISNLLGVSLCVAAGNESQARHHSSGIIPAQGETQNLDIKVGSEGAGDFFTSIWTGISDRISVAIRSPTGEFVPRTPTSSGIITITNLLLEQSSVRVSYYFPVEISGGQLTAIKIIKPTQGIWTIILYGDLILDGKFNAWLPLTGFVDPSIEFLNADPNYTITIPATMNGGIICGAYNQDRNSLYIDTSWGPTRINQISPDLVAPGVDIVGYSPSGLGVMSGTSAATAMTAGAAALMLEWGIVRGNDPAMSTYEIRAYMIRGCTRSETQTYPNNRWGYGSLNLIRSFELMREI